jgi:hypothetical protein
MIDYNNVERRFVGVIVERRTLDNPWADNAWLPLVVLPDVPETPAWTEIERGKDFVRYYAGAAALEMFPTETETLVHNLDSGAPCIFVTLRRRSGEVVPGREVDLFAATACVGTAEVMTEAGDDIVHPVPMPAEIAGWVAEFVVRHHVERPKYKRKRQRADPDRVAPPPRPARGE